MARIDVPEGEGLEASRMWMLAPHIGAGVSALGKATYVESSLPIREREVARMRIAQLNQCVV
jgi:alkylhydroperoxidase family enzyme